MASVSKSKMVRSLFFLICITTFIDPSFAADREKDELINCDIQNQACTEIIEGASVSLDIQPKPVKAMEDLVFTVSITGGELTGPPLIDLKMPAMKMGKNQVKMIQKSKGVYQGKGIIVRCKSGKTMWQAVVHLPGIGKVDFIFDVVY